jgi:dTMP kinase
MFITFEGMDGAGKTTQINLLKKHLEEKGYDVVLTREPGGTEVCEKIRDIILDKDHFGMNNMCEAFLYAASRAEHVEKVIKPALKAGKIVICDRFVHSSIAYQGYGRGLGKEVVAAINDRAVDGVYPDMTFFMMLPADNVHNRINQSGKDHDRLEKENVEFFERISKGYMELAENEDKSTILNAKDSIESISKNINCVVDNIIENMS